MTANAKYGTFIYGDGTKYGAGAASTSASLTWIVEIDWNGDGLFNGANDASKMLSIQTFRGRRDWLRSDGTGFEPQQTGKAIFTLDNTDRRYDTYYTSSPLYPYVTPGKDVRIKVKDNLAGTIYPVFYGVITDIQPGGYSDEPFVTVTVEDGWRFLRNTYGHWMGELSHGDIDIDTCVGYTLNNAKWPSRWGAYLDAIATRIPYWWIPSTTTAGKLIEDTVNVALQYFYIDNQGRAHLKDVAGSYGYVIIYQETDVLKNIQTSRPWTNAYNIVNIVCRPRALQANSELFRLYGSPSIAPGATISFYGSFSYNGQNCPISGVTIPTINPTTDWTTNTAEDGSGTDKTANCTMNFSFFPDGILAQITNNDASTVYVNFFRVFAQALTEQNTAYATYPANLSTVVQPKQFTIDNLWFQDINNAATQAYALWQMTNSMPACPRIEVENNFDHQFLPDLFDSVRVNFAYLGALMHPHDFRVGGIEHTSIGGTENCQAIRTKFYLEPWLHP